MTRALFVNSGMLGHQTFSALMADITARVPGLEARHVNLSRDLTVGDRVIRRLLSARLTPRSGPAANLDLRRWREELNIGLLAARRIAKAERHAPFDLLHFHTQATAYGSVARMKRTPAIVSLDCTQHLASLEASSRLARASYQANVVHDGHVFRAATAIVATSEWAARDLAAGYPDCASKVSVLPFPVDLAPFSEDWIAERASRAAKGERPRALFIGGDFSRKGGPALLDAWREGGFSDRADLDVVTDWPIPADEVPNGARVTSGITPYTDRWLDMWRRADLFVMPSLHEAFGIVYEEAGASGIPAIGSDITSISETIRHDATGLLVPPGDRRALIGALRALIDSAVLRERMGRAARRAVAERAAVPVYAARLGSIIRNVVAHDVRQPA
jgi:glycosyltransferase involved in cell wall biosynthesis